jgi:Transposase
MDASGKLVMESILEIKAATLLQFLAGLHGNLSVTFEEGTWAAWLYDVLKPRVTHLVVCNPRKNALLKVGSKSDRIDARKLVELLRGNHLKPVYHGETGVRMLRELARSYLTIVEDQSRVNMKVITRQVNEVTIVDLSGQIKLGEGSSVVRDTVKDLLGKGRKKILLNLGDVNYIHLSREQFQVRRLSSGSS